MALTAKLQLRQSQSLVMTPQLMQSIKLLQLTHIELDRFVDEEIERNPLLDRAEPRDDAATDQLQKQEGSLRRQQTATGSKTSGPGRPRRFPKSSTARSRTCFPTIPVPRNGWGPI